MQVSKSFTALGVSIPVMVKQTDLLSFAISGTFVGTVEIERSTDNGTSFQSVQTITGVSSGTILEPRSSFLRAVYRVRCSAFTSGTIVCAFGNYVPSGDYGLDLGVPQVSQYGDPILVNKADLRIRNDICTFQGTVIPVDGTDGTDGTGWGFAGTGSTYICRSGTDKGLYFNSGTITTPVLKKVTVAA